MTTITGPRLRFGLFSVLCAVVLTGGCVSQPRHTEPGAAPAAAELLGQLVIAPEDTGVHYRREDWGEDWAHHGEGCDTRELVLRAQGTGWIPGKACRPLCPELDDAGRPRPPCWTSPYDDRATHDPGALDIDHRVSVADAARSRVVGGSKGAGRVWTPEQKHAFYQDQNNLVAVTAAINSGKRDRDFGTWRPPNRAHWCHAATQAAATKVTYRLTVDQREHDALRQMLATCPAANGSSSA